MYPDAIIDACRTGIEQHRRHQVGGTAPSLFFAETIADGFPVDDDMLTEAAQAHAMLDRADDLDADRRVISRMLWGGPDAPQWLADQLRQPVAAAIDQFAGLNKIAETLDAEVWAKIEGAIQIAVLAAARAIGARLVASVNRVPNPIRAELDRSAVEGARPYGTYWAIPSRLRIAAELDVEDAVAQVVADLQLTVQEILDQHSRKIIRQIAAETDLTPEEVEVILVDMEPDHNAAVLLLGSLFLAWVSRKFADRTGDPIDPEDAVDSLKDVPVDIVRIVVSVVGGAVHDGTGLIRDDIGQVLDKASRPTGGSATLGRIRDITDSLPDVDTTVEFEWIYGSPSTRKVPYDPHVALGGVTWRLDNPSADIIVSGDNISTGYDGYYPGDHIGCQCRISTRLVAS